MPNTFAGSRRPIVTRFIYILSRVVFSYDNCEKVESKVQLCNEGTYKSRVEQKIKNLKFGRADDVKYIALSMVHSASKLNLILYLARLCLVCFIFCLVNAKSYAMFIFIIVTD